MKLTLTLLLIALVQVKASVFAQRVSIHVKDQPLEYVLNSIRNQTGYDVFFNAKALERAFPVTVSLKNADLKTALKAIFEGQPFDFSLELNTVVVRTKVKSSDINLNGNQTQQHRVTGTVTNEAGEPIVGVTVIIPKRAIVRTDKFGRYILNLIVNRTYTLPASDSIYFQHIAYQFSKFKIPPSGVLDVVLKEKKNAIDEVVVTGIFKKSIESFTGASTTVSGIELQRAGTRNLITSLRNIDPSFNIIESNTFGSNPNRMPEIQIRGNSSIPNVDELQDQTRVDLNTPLIILDGFQSTLQKLLDINENEVESITILKDASATAIYGSRGSNGVVVITTIAPMPGKLKVTYRADINLEAPDLSAYSLLNARDKLDLEFKAGYYNNARAESDLPLKRYYNYLLNEVNSGVETDWMALPLRNAVGQRHNLRLEGGEQNLRYSASAQLNDIQGVMKGSNRKTFNGNITLTFDYNNVRFRNNLQVSENRTAESPYGTFSDYVKMNPYWRAYDENGEVLKQLGYPGNTDYLNRWSSLPTNPLYNSTLNTFDKTKYSELTNNTQIEWNKVNGLYVRGQFGITKRINQSDRFRPADHTAFANYSEEDVFRKGDYRYGVGNNLQLDGSLNVQYSKVIHNVHSIFAGVDYNVRQLTGSSYSFLVEGFNNPNFDFVSMALQYEQDGKPGGSESKTRAVGATGNVNYIYNNRYFLDASLRYDGSSQFGSRQRYAPFWSTGLGWNMHNEAFLKGHAWINRLKLRGSMGITGSQNFNAYQALSTYSYYTDDRYYNWNGAYLLGLGNDELRWQQAKKYDIGVDAELFAQRIKLTADVYSETTNDLVSSVNLPASNGFSSYVANIGRMRNNGFEVKLTGVIVNKRNWFWSVTGAAIKNQNKVLETSQALKDAQLSIQNGTTDPGVMYVEGYSSNAIWVVPSLGIDPSTGKELYLDNNGKPTYTWNGSYVRAMGNTDPKVFGNFSTMVRFKSLSLNAIFGYRYGANQYNSTLVNRVETGNYQYNVDQRVYDDRWQQPGDNAAFKGLLVTTPTYKTSRFVQKENTLECQNINLQYDVRNKVFLKKFGLSAFLVSANMADVFYLSTVKRERGTAYPFSRQFSLNFNATF